MPKKFPPEFKREVVAVARRGVPLADVAEPGTTRVLPESLVTRELGNPDQQSRRIRLKTSNPGAWCAEASCLADETRMSSPTAVGSFGATSCAESY